MPGVARAQTAKEEGDRLCALRKQKFDLVLPAAMRENKIDMWIVAMKEGMPEPNQDILGGDGILSYGYFIFTDRGGPGIETAALKVAILGDDACGAYKVISKEALRTFVAARNPKRIAIDVAEEIGVADGLSYTLHRKLVKDLGEPYASRLVSAEHLVSDFRSRQVPLETVIYGEAGEISRHMFERALTSEVIHPGHTTARDVSNWILDRFREKGLTASWKHPNVWIVGPNPTTADNEDTVIQPGDIVSIDGGVHYLTMSMDIKRSAYVLKPGETDIPAGIKRAWDRAIVVRDLVTSMIKPGRIAGKLLDEINARIDTMPGYVSYGQREDPRGGPSDTDVLIGPHATGEGDGHGSGPSLNIWPARSSYQIRPGNALTIELFVQSPIPEWNGKKLSMWIEDDAVVTADGVGWVHSPQDSLIAIR